LQRLEKRRMLNADPVINLGAVYIEDELNTDDPNTGGDYLYFSFSGGDPATQLSTLTIDTTPGRTTLENGDPFFDTAAGGLGDSGHNALTIDLTRTQGINIAQLIANNPILSNSASLDGQTSFTLDLTGCDFDAGDILVLRVDVDEMGRSGATSAIVEGAEFHGSEITATFQAPTYENTTITGTYQDAYAFQDPTLGTNLPPDAVSSPLPNPTIPTAGAETSLTQESLPITLSGTVYEDFDADGIRDLNETTGIGGVTLSLYEFDNGSYQLVKTTTTDGNGFYSFDVDHRGTYRVVESQPSGYYSTGSETGEVGGIERGSTDGPNALTDIILVGGESSVNNDFGEALPASLAGTVFEDLDNDGIHDAGEPGIGNVTLNLYDDNDQLVATTTTDGAGNYLFENLGPGTYTVREVQPNGYLDGIDSPGSAGGVALTSPGDQISGILLTSGTVATDYDFGEYRPASLSGLVFADNDDDCIQDPGEVGIQNVEMQLLDVNGSVVQTTYTDADGRFSFENLLPGTYSIREIQPSGYFEGHALVGTAGGTGVQPNDITDIILTSGEQGVDYVFCEIPPANVSGHVYIDTDNDGVFDGGESGIAGVTLNLFDNNNQFVGTTTTNAAGYYEFTNLMPGTYTVREVQPTGFYDGIDTPGSVGGTALPSPGDQLSGIVLVGGTQAVNYNFGELEPASLSGFVYDDTDGDCEHDPGELGIAGVTMQLYDGNGDLVATTQTDQNGNYTFDNLRPGAYSVVEIQPSGYLDGGQDIGTAGGTSTINDRIDNIVLGSGVDATGYDFCETTPASLSGFVFEDLDNDGLREAGESGIGGVTLQLFDSSGVVVATTSTNPDGSYTFQNLEPDTYTIREVQPSGYLDGTDTAGSLGGIAQNPGDEISTIAVLAGQDGVHYNFGEYRPGSLNGRVFADYNGDCTFNGEDLPLQGVTIQLYNESGQLVGTTVTNSAGQYQFDGLAPGSYSIVEIQPTGYFEGAAWPGTAGGVAAGGSQINSVTLVSNQQGLEYNFCEKPPASLSGHVVVDVNDNGVFDNGEPGIVGVTVELLNGNGQVVGTTTTDANGFYSFGGLAAGTYSVREVQPAGYFDGTDSAGTAGGVAQNPGDLISSISLVAGMDAENYNFTERLPGRIAGDVLLDQNGNCVQDPGEVMMANVEIQLLDSNGQVIASTLTDSNGQFAFENLAPGTYTVRQIQPGGVIGPGDVHVGNSGGVITDPNQIVDINIGGGTNANDIRFCEIPPSSISGFVFQDGGTIIVDPNQPVPDITTIRDGIRTPDDLAIAGVTIQLLDNNGNIVATTLTGANGSFTFTGLAAGNYSLQQIHPFGYTDYVDTPGTGGGTALAGQDRITNITLGTGVNIGDYWFSEVRIAEQPTFINPPPNDPPPGLPPVLLARSPVPFIPGPLIAAVGSPGINLDAGASGAGQSLGTSVAFTWHLTTIDAGYPRGDVTLGYSGPETITEASTARERQLNLGAWIMPSREQLVGLNDEGGHVYFGVEGGIPVVGDFNGDGISDVGMFLDGEWFIDLNGNGKWDDGDLWIKMGRPGDKPVVGDWNGDGKDDVGVWGPKWSNDDRAIAAEAGLPAADNLRTGDYKNLPPEPEGAPDEPRVLKFNDGRPVEIGSLRGQLAMPQGDGDQARMIRLEDGTMVRADVIDHVFEFGDPGDVPVVGDFTGDGVPNMAVYNNGTWKVDTNGDGKFGDGDWNFESSYRGTPVVGDWNGDGVDEIGIYSNGQWIMDTNGDFQLDTLDKTFELGEAGDQPIVGDWNGDGRDEPGLYRASERGSDAETARTDSVKQR
jgi:protocatechuate 3,4-dioxygenase beta subunit